MEEMPQWQGKSSIVLLYSDYRRSNCPNGKENFPIKFGIKQPIGHVKLDLFCEYNYSDFSGWDPSI